jgi:hypothetical protein
VPLPNPHSLIVRYQLRFAFSIRRRVSASLSKAFECRLLWGPRVGSLSLDGREAGSSGSYSLLLLEQVGLRRGDPYRA